MKKIKQYSKALRKNLTDAENLLWYRLRDRRFYNYKFRRHVPIGNYIADFVCNEKHLIIEVNGGQHDNNEYDFKRTNWLNQQGFHVCHFWNNEVLENLEGVLETILSCANTPHPVPLPQGRGNVLFNVYI